MNLNLKIILMSLSILILSLAFFTSCISKKENKPSANIIIKPAHSSDTSRYTIIPFDKNMFYIFGKADTVKPATLTEQEIEETESLLTKAIAEYNRKKVSEYLKIDSFVNYRRQFVPYINQKGEKMVFVNCFCDGFKWNENWRKELVMVDDGGSCFFNVKINLSAKNTYDLYVNGVA